MFGWCCSFSTKFVKTALVWENIETKQMVYLNASLLSCYILPFNYINVLYIVLVDWEIRKKSDNERNSFNLDEFHLGCC